MHGQLTPPAAQAMLPQVDALPAAEGEPAAGYRNGQLRSRQRGTHVGRHVVGSVTQASWPAAREDLAAAVRCLLSRHESSSANVADGSGAHVRWSTLTGGSAWHCRPRRMAVRCASLTGRSKFGLTRRTGKKLPSGEIPIGARLMRRVLRSLNG